MAEEKMRRESEKESRQPQGGEVQSDGEPRGGDGLPEREPQSGGVISEVGETGEGGEERPSVKQRLEQTFDKWRERREREGQIRELAKVIGEMGRDMPSKRSGLETMRQAGAVTLVATTVAGAGAGVVEAGKPQGNLEVEASGDSLEKAGTMDSANMPFAQGDKEGQEQQAEPLDVIIVKLDEQGKEKINQALAQEGGLSSQEWDQLVGDTGLPQEWNSRVVSANLGLILEEGGFTQDSFSPALEVLTFPDGSTWVSLGFRATKDIDKEGVIVPQNSLGVVAENPQTGETKAVVLQDSDGVSHKETLMIVPFAVEGGFAGRMVRFLSDDNGNMLPDEVAVFLANGEIAYYPAEGFPGLSALRIPALQGQDDERMERVRLAGFNSGESWATGAEIKPPELPGDTFDETAAILENALFLPENQIVSTDGMYRFNVSRGYLDQVARANSIYFDQQAFDKAVARIFTDSFQALNQGLRRKGLPEKTLDDVVRLKPFVQIGGRLVGEGEIQGRLNNGVIHYLCTTEEMVTIREKFRENLTNQDFIEISFLHGSESKSLGFMYFDAVSGKLTIVSKPGRLPHRESPYLSWHPIKDSVIVALFSLADSMGYAEVGTSVFIPNFDEIYNTFGCTQANQNCNPNLVRVN